MSATPDLTSTSPSIPRERVTTARLAVFVTFTLAGLVFASWAARIADTKQSLGLTAGQLGLTLFAASVGSVVGLPLAGRISERIGATRAVALGMGLSLAGLLAVGLVVDAHGPRAAVAGGLFFIGMGVGVWDVSMNLEGADVERHLGTSVMPHFHAAFSGGTVVSALIGAAMSRAGVPLTVHFLGAAVVTVALGWWALPRFLPRSTEQPAAARAARKRHRSAWLEPRTLLIGVVVFAAAFTEGTANDWLAVAFVEGHDLQQWMGVLAFATFLTFMTVGRIAGTGLLDRYGRVPVLRVSFALAALGAALVILGSSVGRVRGHRGLGGRRRARLPGRDECLGRRAGTRRGPDVGRRDHRLRRLPGRPAGAGPARRPGGGAALAHRGGSARRSSPSPSCRRCASPLRDEPRPHPSKVMRPGRPAATIAAQGLWSTVP